MSVAAEQAAAALVPEVLVPPPALLWRKEPLGWAAPLAAQR